jgi:cytochrome c556
MYEANPQIWDCRHREYKDRDKKMKCWQAMADATSTSVAEVQRKIHNLRNQVCTACIVFFV